MLSTFTEQIIAINRKLNDDFMKAMMAKVMESKNTLLKSHNAVIAMLPNQIGDGVIKLEDDGISEMRVAFDAQTLIIDEIMNDLIDEMKMKHRRKMDLIKKATDGMIEIATRYGLDDGVRIKSEVDGASMNSNDESLADDVPTIPVPLDDAPTECDDELTESEENGISTSLRDLYIPGVNLQCKICDTADTLFYFHSDFRNHHIVNHGVLKPYQCSQCDVSYGTKRTLTMHIESIHQKITRFECNICHKRFYYKQVLEQHMNTHGDARPYRCGQCGKTFKKQSNRYDHIQRVHKKEVRYRCRYCQKGFYYKPNFINHIRTHTGEKPFQCDICNKSFSQKVNLKTHKRTHSGEKPFHCNSCSKSFADRSSLNRHKRIHSGIKPYQCSKCHKRFTRNSSKNKHEGKCQK